MTAESDTGRGGSGFARREARLEREPFPPGFFGAFSRGIIRMQRISIPPPAQPLFHFYQRVLYDGKGESLPTQARTFRFPTPKRSGGGNVESGNVESRACFKTSKEADLTEFLFDARNFSEGVPGHVEGK
ncbi:hypothetical protein QWJ34_23305 [Saccharibacillus sp. CPCC 101409]|uniref:hypothetical protein n=1 Tax=Saccharibacillus sp. CPCC 101409 TaxID=3058041 RepID=UPI00267154D2|nr:hypothetical protein [Saccharibacillus sp. CPCC 101409]MDO3412714.1 hypothetical protein [Saccharibacillus sp. CPCC 101409]